MKSVKPWPANTECPLDGFAEFKKNLNTASFHNAAPVYSEEAAPARSALLRAVDVAIAEEWPYWVMDRMFKEVRPLVDWTQFMQAYINVLHTKVAV
jgi:hypothetical protein